MVPTISLDVYPDENIPNSQGSVGYSRRVAVQVYEGAAFARLIFTL